MVKTKKSLLLVLVVMLVLAMSLTFLVSCSNTEYTVTFMMKENGTGEWKEYGTPVKADKDGKVTTMPEEPKVDGYSFRGWYTDEACTSGNEFDGTNITADMKVYAFLSNKILTVNIKKSADNTEVVKEQTVADLTKLETANKQSAIDAGLTFDGWYTNKECTTKYSAETGATEVFGRYVAKVTFNNGYEAVGTAINVVPGEKIKIPSVDEIVKPYMSKNDIFYIKADGTDYDFEKDVFTGNTEITVEWRSPFIEFKAINGSVDKVELSGINFDEVENWEDFNTLPIVSVPRRVFMPSEEDPNKMVEKKVVSVDASFIGRCNNAKKVIFRDGIQYISNLNSGYLEPFGGDQMALEEVVLPNTLKVLEKSFNNFGTKKENLKGINLPDSLEVVIDCFWSDYVDYYTAGPRRGNTYTFEIKMPKNVKTVSLVPAKVGFDKDSKFKTDVANNRVYMVEGSKKTLVSDVTANVKEGILEVPADVTGLQVYTFNDIAFDYLNIPSSVKEVKYLTNDSVGSYDFYTGNMLTDMSRLTDSNYVGNDAYSIVNDLNNHKYVVFATSQMPSKISNYAFSNGRTPHNLLEQPKVVFTGEITSGNLDIAINFTNTKMAEYSGFTSSKIKVNNNVTTDMIANLIAFATGQAKDIIKVTKVTTLGKEFVEGAKNTHQYLDVEYEFDYTGITTQVINGNELKVTGFDKSTALNLNGTYQVNIPDEIDGKKVVEVAENAFNNPSQDHQKISQIFVGKNVKKIGDYAFANLSNLDHFTVAEGGALAVIGAHSFEYTGAIKDAKTGKYIANPDLPKAKLYRNLPSVIISIPLDNITSIGAAAFNTPAIRAFETTESELARGIYATFGFMSSAQKLPELNKFYYQAVGNDMGFISIVKYVGEEDVTVNKNPAKQQNVEYYATAGGAQFTGTALAFGLVGGNGCINMTIKTGSVYLYNRLDNGIFFALCDKVEANAFVYVDESIIDPDNCNFVVMKSDANRDCWLKKDVVIAQSQAKYVEGNIFADGWFMGKDNKTNKFMTNIKESSGNFPGM